ncbi:MAG: VOC family protein [Actinomycetota bacterium]|nr:VOC family protein [Actinomycetota bacterium]
MANPVVHFEIIGAEPEKIQSFYSRAFDWKIDTNNPMSYGMVSTQGDAGYGINGGIGAPVAPDYPGHLTFYVEVADVAAALEKITELGGKTLMERTELPMVTVGMFTDPFGHVVGLVEPPREAS